MIKDAPLPFLCYGSYISAIQYFVIQRSVFMTGNIMITIKKGHNNEGNGSSHYVLTITNYRF